MDAYQCGGRFIAGNLIRKSTLSCRQTGLAGQAAEKPEVIGGGVCVPERPAVVCADGNALEGGFTSDC
jgi:hypothetical protein